MITTTTPPSAVMTCEGGSCTEWARFKITGPRGQAQVCHNHVVPALMILRDPHRPLGVLVHMIES